MTNSTPSGVINSTLAQTIIARDLLDLMKAGTTPRYKVIIDFDTRYVGGAAVARRKLLALAPKGASAGAFPFTLGDKVSRRFSLLTDTYLFAEISAATIDQLLEWAKDENGPGAIYKIWNDTRIERHINQSARTVNCDAARATYASDGKGIVWAVADTGIDGEHIHFKTHDTLQKLPDGVQHVDFTALHDDDTDGRDVTSDDVLDALPHVDFPCDGDGHGTHVAGIIAGETFTAADRSPERQVVTVTASSLRVKRQDASEKDLDEVTRMTGMAPLCKLLSLRVLIGSDGGQTSSLLAALGYIQRINTNGRDIKVHGVNISVGYDPDPVHYAAGQSPLCSAIDRLVNDGVVVVVAAGNSGYGIVNVLSTGPDHGSLLGTIADPGNARHAITVGSTHRSEPDVYGISYFSAKGPTADGRMKPDLVAPGERIVSCALCQDGDDPALARFKEDSGTSMAAPHVSGVAAALLSRRSGYKGHPSHVKKLLKDTAIDLGRQPEYQGAGMVDLMRALHKAK